MVELDNITANEVAALLARVVPRGQTEADRLAALIRHLSRAPLRHDRDILGG